MDRGTLVSWGSPETVLRDPLPPAILPPVGVRIEEGLRGAGCPLGPGKLDPEAVARRIAVEAQR